MDDNLMLKSKMRNTKKIEKIKIKSTKKKKCF